MSEPRPLTDYEAAVLRHGINPDMHSDGADWWPACHASFVARKAEWPKRIADAEELLAAVKAGAYVTDVTGRMVQAEKIGPVDPKAVVIAEGLLAHAKIQAAAFADPDACAERALADKVTSIAKDRVFGDGVVMEGYDSMKARLGDDYETRAEREAREKVEAAEQETAKAAAVAQAIAEGTPVEQVPKRYKEILEGA